MVINITIHAILPISGILLSLLRFFTKHFFLFQSLEAVGCFFSDGLFLLGREKSKWCKSLYTREWSLKGWEQQVEKWHCLKEVLPDTNQAFLLPRAPSLPLFPYPSTEWGAVSNRCLGRLVTVMSSSSYTVVRLRLWILFQVTRIWN